MSDAYWLGPARWNRHAVKTGVRERVFCASMADVFDAEGLESERVKLWQLIRETPMLDWLLLTKRPGLIRKMLPEDLWGAPNIWLGTSVESPDYLWRIKELLEVPAAKHFLSVEPLLESIPELPLAGIDWVIVGGESGPQHREMSLRAFWGIVKQVQAAKVPLFVKQDSARKDGRQGRIRDELWIREYPITGLVRRICLCDDLRAVPLKL
jgi:protein gp37